MILREIVAEIEKRAAGLEIARLQEIRKELKDLKRLPHNSIFHPDSVKENDGYAFHYGGRREIQFNVGFEGDIFRHGLAFSFEPSQTLPNIEVLVPSVRRFNEFLELYPHEFADMMMWYWDHGTRSTDYPPAPMRPELVRKGVFAFLGRAQDSAQIDFDLFVRDFERLLPLYRFVEGSRTFPGNDFEQPVSQFKFQPGCRSKASSTSSSLSERELDVRLRHNDIEFGLYKSTSHGYMAKRT